MKPADHSLSDQIRRWKDDVERDMNQSQERAAPDYQRQRSGGEKRVREMNHPRLYKWRYINE